MSLTFTQIKQNTNNFRVYFPTFSWFVSFSLRKSRFYILAIILELHYTSFCLIANYGELQGLIVVIMQKKTGYPPVTSFTSLKKKSCDMWHVTRGLWYMTRGMWHLTREMWGDVNLLSKFQLPSSYSLGVKVCWRYFHRGSVSDLKNEWMNELMRGVFVEQHWVHH